MHCDILDDMEDVKFEPSDRQLLFKLTLHKKVPSSVLGRLYIDTLELVKNHISPFSIEEVKSWASMHTEFMTWLLAPDDYELKIHKAKLEAAECLVELMRTPADDPRVLAVKLKAAEAILKIDNKPQVGKITNTVRLPSLPKDLERKSIDALQGELRKLQEASGV